MSMSNMRRKSNCRDRVDDGTFFRLPDVHDRASSGRKVQKVMILRGDEFCAYIIVVKRDGTFRVKFPMQ